MTKVLCACLLLVACDGLFKTKSEQCVARIDELNSSHIQDCYDGKIEVQVIAGKSYEICRCPSKDAGP